jgi:hypothetical protein
MIFKTNYNFFTAASGYDLVRAPCNGILRRIVASVCAYNAGAGATAYTRLVVSASNVLGINAAIYQWTLDEIYFMIHKKIWMLSAVQETVAVPLDLNVWSGQPFYIHCLADSDCTAQFALTFQFEPKK